MPKHEGTAFITEQEKVFARLLLSGTMTDREAAEAAGLNSDTAAETKAEPRVRAYMLECRAAMQRRKEERREQVLDRLWELAIMSPEMTRGSITGQVKAIQMIVAIEAMIPDRRAAAAGKKSAPPLPPVDIYASAWLRERQGQTIDPQPDPVPQPEQDDPRPAVPEPAPVAAANVPPPPGRPIGPAYDRSQSVFAQLFHPSEAPAFEAAPDTRVPLWMQRIPKARRRC